jgi:chromate reductase, NAD(P)H dehydrogenase (quinone)
VIGASQGAFGAAWAQAELRKVLQTLGASVEQRELAVPHTQHAFAADGLLRDPEQRAMLTSILEALRGQNPRQSRRLT